MTQTQKIIKYVATAFAVFFIVTIFSGILSCGFVLLNIFDLIDGNESVISDNVEVISDKEYDISSLDLDLAYTKLEIKVDDEFKVETNNSKLVYTNRNGNVRIKDNNRNWLNNKDSILTISIPSNLYLDRAYIDTGAGKINIESLNARNLNLKIGAGEVNIDNMTITGSAKINGGVGKTTLKSCQINDLKADLGVGEFSFNGRLTGKNEFDSGVGSVNISLIDDMENYKIDVDKGIGSIKLDGEKIDSDRVYGTGVNEIEIDGGVGEIKINFEDQFYVQ